VHLPFARCESVLDPTPECINPGGQHVQPAIVDLPLEPSDLITQVAKILGDVFRTRPSWATGWRTGF
jgi:hypothetical protein